MTIEQITKRNKEIMKNALLWAKNENCTPLQQIDISIIGMYLNINIPKCFVYFGESQNPNHVLPVSGYGTIFKTLDSIQKKLLESEDSIYELLR